MKLNREQGEILRDNQVISEGLNSRLKEASTLTRKQEIEFKNIVDQITALLDNSLRKINQMLLKVRNPMLSTEELFDIFNEISVLFFDNKTSIYF